jgi:uncharacterized RDD family membrane protein YckC
MALTTGLRRVHVILTVLAALWALLMLIAGLSERNQLGAYVIAGIAPLAAYLLIAWIVSGLLAKYRTEPVATADAPAEFNPYRPPAATVEPVADPTAERDAVLSMPLASGWSRYWGRMVDLLVASVVVGMVIGIIAPKALEAEWLQGRAGAQLSNIVFLPFALIADAVLTSIFGNSLGKWLVGTRVLPLTGGRATLSVLLARNLRAWWAGFGLGIPIVTLILFIRSKIRLDDGELLSWDVASDTRCVDVRVTPVRQWLTAVLGVLLTGSVLALDSLV